MTKYLSSNNIITIGYSHKQGDRQIQNWAANYIYSSLALAFKDIIILFEIWNYWQFVLSFEIIYHAYIFT